MPAETHVTGQPLEPEEVLLVIQERLAEILEIDEKLVVPMARFREDLEADSIALIELVEALEAELSERTVGFRIDDEDLVDLSTVSDAVDYIMARLAKIENKG
ncbi:MAG: acyl carrier protein [Acidimicrobiia bacterium]|nr:acyl carrier protein [Acidimicrobiia bacterium]